MATWMNQRWRLNLLPPTIWQQLADSLDVVTPTGLGYPRFAAELRIRGVVTFSTQEIELIRTRSQGSSSTYNLLLEYDTRGGTVQGVQRALENIGHIALEIIPSYLASVAIAEQNVYPGQYAGYNLGNPGPFTSGYQNTEPPSCHCPQCCSAYQNPPIPPQRSRISLNGSVYTGSSVSRIRIPNRNGRPRSGSANPCPDQNVAAAATGGRSEASSFEIYPEQREQVSRPLPNTEDNYHIKQNLAEKGPSEEIGNNRCFCEECRLRTDSDQTQRLTLQSDPKVPCMLRQGHGVPANIHGRDRTRNSEAVSSDFSQLYLDSVESYETSVEDVEYSDETFVKRTFTESESDENGSRLTQTSTSNRRPICSKGQHRLGERVNDCTVCGNYAGAKPKTGTRPRNNSAPEKNGKTDMILRKSWHDGMSENKDMEAMRKIHSDSKLLISQSSFPNITLAKRTNSIDTTIYSRISSHSSGSSGSRTRSSNNADSSEMGINSGFDVYQNNLESCDSHVGLNQQIGARNIVQSDSSNWSGMQHDISQGQQCPDSIENAQLRSRSAANPHQNKDSQLSAQQEIGSTANAAQISASIRNVPSRSAFSAQINQDGRSGDFVLVTYSWNGMTDPESLLQEIIEMCYALREEGIRVKIDMDEASYAALRLNRLDWIDRNVREAKYVIVCVTPTYAADIREPGPNNQASPRSGQLNARYIFDKLREEYYANSSQNRRIIPVMFSSYGTTQEHVPSCMRSTIVFKYPINIDDIIAAILGYGRIRPS